MRQAYFTNTLFKMSSVDIEDRLSESNKVIFIHFFCFFFIFLFVIVNTAVLY